MKVFKSFYWHSFHIINNLLNDFCDNDICNLTDYSVLEPPGGGSCGKWLRHSRRKICWLLRSLLTLQLEWTSPTRAVTGGGWLLERTLLWRSGRMRGVTWLSSWLLLGLSARARTNPCSFLGGKVHDFIMCLKIHFTFYKCVLIPQYLILRPGWLTDQWL